MNQEHKETYAEYVNRQPVGTPKLECTHYGIDSDGDYYGTSNPPQETDWNYTYCPNCGKKL